MQRCPKLCEYALFIAEVRKNIKAGLPLKDGIEKALDFCIMNNILADILRGHKAEVTEMLLKEYDEALHIANEKEISYDQGFLAGQLKEQEKTRQESQRADEATQRADEATQRADEATQRADNESLRADILAGKLNGLSNTKIAEKLDIPISTVEQIVKNALNS